MDDKAMEAFLLKNSIADLLEKNAKGRYEVITPQRRKSDAENILAMPEVTVFFAEGSIDRKSSGNSPYDHDVTFNIHIAVGAKARVNLAVLQNPAATPEQFAAALAESTSANLIVDEKLDELLSVLFDIIMRPEHRNLGVDYFTNRWVRNMKKQNPENIGSIVIGTASITMTARCYETVTGEVGVPAGKGAIDTKVILQDESKQGVISP